LIAASAANMYNCAVSIYAQYVPVAEGERITDENLNSAIVKVGCNHEAEITFPEMSFPQADATKGEILAVLGGAGLKLKGQCMSVAVNGKYSQNCFVVRGE
ncbi:MAG: hypothetical protein ACXVCS_21375, partial [Bdellovibrionota bacterium]